MVPQSTWGYVCSRGCLRPALLFLPKSWRVEARCVTLSPAGGGGRQEEPVRHACYLMHLSWLHIQPPAVGPWLFKGQSPACCGTRTKANLEGLPCGCLYVRLIQPGFLIPTHWTSGKAPHLPGPQPFHLQNGASGTLLRVKQDNHIRCLKQCWLRISTQYTVARIVTIITRATGYVDQTSQTVMGT